MRKELHKSQIFSLVLLGCILGIAAGSFFDYGARFIFWMVLGCILTAPFILRSEQGIVVLVIFCALIFGMARFQLVAEAPSTLLNIAKTFSNKQEVELKGYVDGDFEITESGGSKFFFRVYKADINARSISIDERIIVFATSLPEYNYGDNLKITGRVKIPEAFEGFDYPEYLQSQGVRTLLFAKDISFGSLRENIGLYKRVQIGFFKNIMAFRKAFMNEVRKAVPEPAAAYVNGVLTGIKTGMSEDVKNAFRITGTSHVLAVSGYNVTLIAQYFLGTAVIWFRRKRAVWFATFGIVLFAILTGGSASVVRAAIMASIVLLASGYGRLADSARAVLLAGTLMVIANPFLLRFDIGFQFSFLSVLGLIYLQPLLSDCLKHLPEWGKIKETGITTLSAFTAVAPLSVYYFHSFPLLIFPANLIILPLIPITMLAGFVTGVGGMIWAPFGSISGYASWALGTFQIGAIRWLSGISWAAIPIRISGFFVIAVYIFIAGIIFLVRGKQTKTAD